MNERFKFRAYVQEGFLSNPGIGGYDQYNKMAEVGGMFFSDGKVEYIVDVDGEEYSYEDKSLQAIMQFTGLHDKDGTEIYEGDVVTNASENLKYQVVYENASFCRKWIDSTSKRIRESLIEPMAWNTHIVCEVIGNIHEHPHLLERD